MIGWAASYQTNIQKQVDRGHTKPKCDDCDQAFKEDQDQ